jgi:RNA polymerase sigma-70 factor (ECF subfamily)
VIVVESVPSPEELVRRCQHSLPADLRPFEQLVTLYKDRVYATAYRLLGNAQEAEDQAQEVFIKVFRGLKQLEEPATVTAWIYRITTTTCLDALDRRQRRPATQPLAANDGQRSEEPRYIDTSNIGPEAAALRRELRECLERTLGQIDQLGRTVLILRDIEGLAYQEIADTLKVGLSAVKMRIHRARLTFQQLFDRLCPGLRADESVDQPMS